MLNSIEIKGDFIQGEKKYSCLEINLLINKIMVIIDKKQNIIGKDEIIAIAFPRNIYLVSTIIACINLQIAFMPIDLTLPYERLEYVFKNYNIRKIICMEKIDLKNIVVDQINLKSELNLGNQNFIPKIERKYGSKIAYVLCTSGTSGKPKAVCIKRESLYNFLQVMPKELKINKGKRIGCFTNVMFDIFFLETVMALYMGLTVVMANESESVNPRKIIKIINDYNINVIQMTPAKMQLLKTVDKEFESLRHVEEIMIGGEVFPKHLLKDLQTYTRARIFNLYGPTEATIWTTVSELTKKKIIDIGHPIQNTYICLIGDDGKKVFKGEVGEICIGGIGVAEGYLNDAELTNKVFEYIEELGQTIYHTGDIGRYDEDGNLLFLGRNDTQIKYHGYRIELQDIEENILKSKDVVDVVVCFDRESIQIVAFYKSDFEINELMLREECKKRIPNYMCPAKFVRVEKFLYTISGKIDRDLMLTTYYTENKWQKILNSEKFIEIIEEFSRYNNLNLETNIDSLGMDSITFIELLVELERQFEIEFEDEMLIQDNFKCVGDIYKLINDCKKDELY